MSIGINLRWLSLTLICFIGAGIVVSQIRYWSMANISDERLKSTAMGLENREASGELKSPATLNSVTEFWADEDNDGRLDSAAVSIRPGEWNELYWHIEETEHTPDAVPYFAVIGPKSAHCLFARGTEMLRDHPGADVFSFYSRGSSSRRFVYIDLNHDGLIDVTREFGLGGEQFERIRIDYQWLQVKEWLSKKRVQAISQDGNVVDLVLGKTEWKFVK